MRLDLNSPQVGGEAPDFDLELLFKIGGRSDKKLELAPLLGDPTAIIFGFYTWPPLRQEAVSLDKIPRQCSHKMNFFCN